MLFMSDKMSPRIVSTRAASHIREELSPRYNASQINRPSPMREKTSRKPMYTALPKPNVAVRKTVKKTEGPEQDGDKMSENTKREPCAEKAVEYPALRLDIAGKKIERPGRI